MEVLAAEYSGASTDMQGMSARHSTTSSELPLRVQAAAWHNWMSVEP